MGPGVAREVEDSRWSLLEGTGSCLGVLLNRSLVFAGHAHAGEYEEAPSRQIFDKDARKQTHAWGLRQLSTQVIGSTPRNLLIHIGLERDPGGREL